VCPEHTIFASNTSAIMITDIAGATKRPDKIIGMHWFYPAQMMKCIEMVKGALTSQIVCEKTKELSMALGKEPVIVEDCPGFSTTRYINIWLLEAVRSFETGIAGIEEIDKMCRLAFGWPMGPIELLDVVGLDTFVHVITYLYEETGDNRFVPPLTVKKLVKSGYIGKKPGSKGGFYEYLGVERKR
jgi:3-hydroxybutyryl-CoA dehydrogenase